jgi:uncharacterized protein
MADSPNIAVVRRLYQARGDPEVIRQVLASDVRWEVVDGFPYGGVYVGLDSVLGDFFGRLFTDFDEFVANGSEFFESGERVIALGNYSGRARRSGKRFTARFAHVWTFCTFRDLITAPRRSVRSQVAGGEGGERA